MLIQRNALSAEVTFNQVYLVVFVVGKSKSKYYSKYDHQEKEVFDEGFPIAVDVVKAAQ